jgi:hypothetical protein
MGKIVCLLALAAMVPVAAVAQSTWSETTNGTWKGTVVEQSCYRSLGIDKASAAEHKACAQDCVKKGQPLGILTDDDGYRQIIGSMSNSNYAKMTQWIGRRVEVQGTSSRDAFSARYIDITKISASK